VPGIKNEVLNAKILSGGDLKVKSEDGSLTLKVPGTAPDPVATVIKVELKGRINSASTAATEKMKTGAID
jgi:alpha-L-fucosidase